MGRRTCVVVSSPLGPLWASSANLGGRGGRGGGRRGLRLHLCVGAEFDASLALGGGV